LEVDVPRQTRVTSDGRTVPVYIDLKRAKNGLKPLSTGNRTFGPGGTVRDVTVTETTNSAGHRVPQATMQLDHPALNGMPPTSVDVEVRFLRPGEFLATPAHGDFVVPARFTLTQDSSGNWRASVEVDARSRPEDVQFLVGHELSEIGSLVHDNPGGVPSGGFGDQMNAGVMHGGDQPGTPTAHDRAAAQEVSALANEVDRLRSVGANQENIDHRRRVLDAAIEAAGLDTPGNVDAKLRLLTQAGAPADLIHRVQLGEAQRVLDDTLGANSNLSASTLQHLMYPGPAVGGFHNGINGGHVTSAVRDFGGPGTPYGFHAVGSAPVAGTTMRQFAQYKWNGSGDKPLPASGAYPGEPNFNPADWQQAATPKTTTDDLGPYLQEVDGALDAWFAANGTAIPNDRRFSAVSPNGVLIEGYFEPNRGPKGLPVVRTAYPRVAAAGQHGSQQLSPGGQTNSARRTDARPVNQRRGCPSSC
jgi:hypothetical protein